MVVVTKNDKIYCIKNIDFLNENSAGNATFVTERYNSITHELINVLPPEYDINGAYKLVDDSWEIVHQDLINKYLASLIIVPQTITKLQAMKQMKIIGKWEAFKAILASDEDINDEWVLSDNLNRSYPLVSSVAQLFEFSDEDMDNFFIEADKLV